MFAALLLKKENTALTFGALKQFSTTPEHGAALDTPSALLKALFLLAGMCLQKLLFSSLIWANNILIINLG